MSTLLSGLSSLRICITNSYSRSIVIHLHNSRSKGDTRRRGSNFSLFRCYPALLKVAFRRGIVLLQRFAIALNPNANGDISLTQRNHIDYGTLDDVRRLRDDPGVAFWIPRTEGVEGGRAMWFASNGASHWHVLSHQLATVTQIALKFENSNRYLPFAFGTASFCGKISNQ